MTEMRRRKLLTTAAALSGGGVAGCTTAMPAVAPADRPRTPFAVAAVTIPIAGSAMAFPVRRIYCIGRNYAAHAREMGSDPTREPPFFFQKPTDAIQHVPPGTVADHPYPTLTRNYHYEVELVVALGKGGRNVPVERGHELVFGYTARALAATRSAATDRVLASRVSPAVRGLAAPHAPRRPS
jgi:2-keto-4-pentenoate hydratase/2-oxohepta-3-ene-1,7-dioic acid hydratase in catechol pathway